MLFSDHVVSEHVRNASVSCTAKNGSATYYALASKLKNQTYQQTITCMVRDTALHCGHALQLNCRPKSISGLPQRNAMYVLQLKFKDW